MCMQEIENVVLEAMSEVPVVIRYADSRVVDRVQIKAGYEV